MKMFRDSTAELSLEKIPRWSRLAARSLKLLGAGLVVFGSVQAQAVNVHIPYSYSYTANWPNLSFAASFSPSRDVPVGTVLQTVSQNGRSSWDVTCPVTKTVTVAGNPVPGMTDVYQTNVPGIGVHFYVSAGWSGTSGKFNSAPFTEVLPITSSATPSTFYTKAELVVTGPVGKGTLTTLPSMTIVFTGDCLDDPIYSAPHIQALNTGTTITGSTCSVTTASVDVPLPTIFPGNFNAGSTGAKPFNIGVNCTQGVTVKVTLTDASNVLNTSTTLGLTSDSTAKGVGLQILNGSTPVAFGPDSAVAGNMNQWTAGTATGGPMTIPLTAQYIKTGTVNPGTVKGAATFTMSYQ